MAPRVWLENIDFSNKERSILLVLTSGNFDKNDYIRNYNDYLKFLKKIDTKKSKSKKNY